MLRSRDIRACVPDDCTDDHVAAWVNRATELQVVIHTRFLMPRRPPSSRSWSTKPRPRASSRSWASRRPAQI